MTERQEKVPAPDIGVLGAAAEHRAAADAAATRQAYDAAVRERYRAAVRGLEQHGVLETERARTARETAAAAARLAPDAAGLVPAADLFDQIVYGRRGASASDYHSVEQADHFSDAPPPGRAPAASAGKAVQTGERRLPRLPQLSPKVWIGLAVIALLVALVLLLPSSCSVPSLPGDIDQPPPDGGGSDPPDDPRKSLFEILPAPVAYGGLQLLLAAVLLVWWRARRRGAIVPEPRLAEVPAHEIVAGQARLYRRSRDYTHVAGKIRAATLRRIRPVLGLLPGAPPDMVVSAVAARGVSPQLAGHALYGAVPDVDMLQVVAAELEVIEVEVHSQ